MSEFIENWRAWLALGCLGVLVVGLNLGLISALRGRRSAGGDAAGALQRAFRASPEARKKQEADLDELHRRVSQLQAPAEPDDSAPGGES